MCLRLAAPIDPLYNPLVEATTSSPDIMLLRVSEEECAALVAAKEVEAALLSPLSYGRATEVADFWILPGPALALEGYTERVWLYFRSDLHTIERCAVPSLQHFLTQALRLLLMEAYDIEPSYAERPATSVHESLRHADAVLSWYEDIPDLSRLDVGEEWFAAFAHALPLAFWSCRAEVASPKLLRSINDLARPTLPESETITESSPYRQGAIHWRWSATIANAVHETLLLLYYHGLVPCVSEVKLWDGVSLS
ncbi:MAG: hypothetical protein NZ473_08240 [Candidatus Kapabacteria bacterium]|nr:hypothetical protein [Candidatus Kapabacteria bacterium]MDW7997434.1 MqnA/MqnD/SBP family protein [Bacteroidota bacterium]MDW8224640.1 MqnA/MqnD/SBP family protein [Bacteroidota bacterium]